MYLRKKRLKQRSANLYWVRSGLLESVNVFEIQKTDAYSSLDLNKIIYNLRIHSRDEKVK
jgi:hypothetical protein